MPRTKYLNNKDLLKEIHKSKTSYCYFLDDRLASFDVIVTDINDINHALIEETRTQKAEKMTREIRSEMKSNKEKPSVIKDFNVDPKSIDKDDIVIRVMTDEHVPLDENKVKKNKKDNKVRCNFPPFKHYIMKNNQVVEVGRSHWRGGFSNGEFCMDHGKMTKELAEMIMKLVEKYSRRPNWSGYCVDEQTEALTKRGWLKFDEITSDDIILSSEEGRLKWSKIKSIFRDDYDGFMHKITNKAGVDMLVTPNHKLLTDRGLVEAELLKEKDRILLISEEENENQIKKYPDEFVELAGWILTEGQYTFDHNGIKNICVYQNEGVFEQRIENCIKKLNYSYSRTPDKGTILFRIFKESAQKFHKELPEKNLSMDFILSLTPEQRKMLIQTMVDGDGWMRKNNNRSYCQKDRKHIDLFQILCILSGMRSNFKLSDIVSFGKETQCHVMNIFSKKRNVAQVETLDFHGGKRNGSKFIGKGKIYHPNEPTSYYKGMVWCPETEYGCFMARRNGTVYITGNSYLSEMKGQALLQLSQFALYFDESKSENPFAYYTQTIANSFTKIWHDEKKVQNIRDDLLQDYGQDPSFARQMEGEGW